MPSLGIPELLILCFGFVFVVAAVSGLVWLLVRLSGRGARAKALRDLEARVARLENERQRPE